MAKAKDEITISKIIDIEKTVRYYLLQSSTASAPSKPTTNPPGGSWSTTEPNYTSGSTSTLYFVDLTVMSDDSFSYSAVSKSSSYEAAKAAYNKATNVEKTVTTFQQTTEGWQMNWGKILNGKDANISKHTDYITFKDGNIKLGDSASAKTLEVSNENVNVKSGEDVVASFGEEVEIGPKKNIKITKDGAEFFDPSNGGSICKIYCGNVQSVDDDGTVITKYSPYFTFGYRRSDGIHKIGELSVSEGFYTTASGKYSHAEGALTTASGYAAHAEGYNARQSMFGASGDYSHSEGANTTASGNYSHAEGYSSTASGKASHSGGCYTIASKDYQTAIGKYNAERDDALFVVGNGAEDTDRSNAMVVTEKGDVQASSFNGHTCTMGTTTCTAKANTPTATHVTFPKAFTSAPIVLLNPLTAVPGTIFKGCSATNITTTGFDLYVTRTDNGNTSVKWIAII